MLELIKNNISSNKLKFISSLLFYFVISLVIALTFGISYEIIDKSFGLYDYVYDDISYGAETYENYKNNLSFFPNGGSYYYYQDRISIEDEYYDVVLTNSSFADLGIPYVGNSYSKVEGESINDGFFYYSGKIKNQMSASSLEYLGKSYTNGNSVNITYPSSYQFDTRSDYNILIIVDDNPSSEKIDYVVADYKMSSYKFHTGTTTFVKNHGITGKDIKDTYDNANNVFFNLFQGISVLPIVLSLLLSFFIYSYLLKDEERNIILKILIGQTKSKTFFENLSDILFLSIPSGILGCIVGSLISLCFGKYHPMVITWIIYFAVLIVFDIVESLIVTFKYHRLTRKIYVRRVY